MSTKQMRILITGASGFIGTNLLDYFLSKENELLNVDFSQPQNTRHHNCWKDVSICDYALLKKTVLDFNPDYIVHLAARTDLNGRSIDDYAANIVGVENLMKIIREVPDLKKIVITSSMLVCRAGYYPKNQFDYAPATLYGASKVETEKIVWANRPDCDWAIIRPTSIWGPWFGVPYRNFFDTVISRRYFHIGKRGCTKTYGYVGNAIYQIEKILFGDTFDEKNKIFYIGDEPATNIEDWANEIASELGYEIKRMPYWILKLSAFLGDTLKLFDMKFPMTSFRLKNMTTNNVVDLSQTYKIAPNPPYSRVEGIKTTLEWLLSNSTQDENLHTNRLL